MTTWGLARSQELWKQHSGGLHRAWLLERAPGSGREHALQPRASPAPGPESLCQASSFSPFSPEQDGGHRSAHAAPAALRNQRSPLHLPGGVPAVVQVSRAEQGGGHHRRHLRTGQG